MKKVFKINLAAVLALFMAFGLMSFTILNKNTQNLEWFEVESSGQISSAAMPSPPSGDCIIGLEQNTCAVELPSGHTYENISEVPGVYTKAGLVEPN